jgi:CoA:oxalate CoA-transferase
VHDKEACAVKPLLDGIRVLDLSNVLAGPFCGYQLALLGADVIKVESPDGGDLARQLGADAALNRDGMGASFLAQNADKRSIVVDLKTEAGKQTFLRLVESADVVLENFRPGVMKRLGLDHEALRALKPELIYCAISGFGQTGPLAKAPAYDQIIQGRSGVMSITGSADSAPLRVGYPVCDTFGGLTAAFAITAALVRRLQSGEGAFLDVSMLDASLSSMGWIVSNLLVAGQQPVPMGNDNFTASPSGTFRTGRGLLNIAANKQDQFETLCDLVGAPELKTDPRFAGREDRKRHREALRVALERQLAGADAAAWEGRLNAAGVPAGQVLGVEQALQQPQVAERGLVATVPFEDGDRPMLSLTASPFLIDGQRQQPRRRPPRLGEHGDEILRELSATPPTP